MPTRGPLCGSSAAPIDSQTNIRSRQASPVDRHAEPERPCIGLNAFFNTFEQRIKRASTVDELMAVARDLAAVHEQLVREGRISRPAPSDQEVRNLVKDILIGDMTAVQQVVAEGVWNAIEEKDLPAGIEAAADKAMWEAFKAVLERVIGKWAKDLASAIKERDLQSILKAFASLGKECADSLADKDGLLREALHALRKQKIGGLDKQMEYRIRKYLSNLLGRTLSGLDKRLEIFLKSKPVVVLRLLFTSSTVPDDAGEMYGAFDVLQEKLSQRFTEIMSQLPQPSIAERFQLDKKPESRPSFRAPH